MRTELSTAPRSSRTASALTAAFALMLVACGGDSAAPREPPATIGMDAGFLASAPAGTALSIHLSVLDKDGNGVANVPVTLTVTGGGGSVSPATVTSGPDGKLAGVVWTLGKSVVPQELKATGAGITASINGTVLTSYPLDLRFFGPSMSPAATAAFTDAASRIRASIVGSLGLVSFPDTLSAKICGGPDQASIGTTTGIIIYASVDSMDGPGKIVGSAFPCFVRTTGGLPVLGMMTFDSADFATLVNDNRLGNVVLHEMLHTVGFGTVWNQKTLLSGRGTLEVLYTGASGISGCVDAGGSSICSTGVPVENCANLQDCGAGSQDSHWREPVFDSELMTGFIEHSGVAMPFSKMTVQSLRDLGYTTNSLAADPYTIPSGSGAAASLQVGGSGGRVGSVQWERTPTPRFHIDSHRNITRIRQ